ncbi:MAG: orotate phosphoribosyltransferase [Bacteroidota bacterium]
MGKLKIADYLLKIKAVSINPKDPYTWSSGWNSPIYCDNRKLLSYPEIRKVIASSFAERIRQDYPQAEGIAGVATGAIAWGALVAEELGLPMVYIRSKAKGHGLQNMVEGVVSEAQQYVVIEDLISTGKSSLKAVKALKESGATVITTLAIFSYGFPEADALFSESGDSFSTLITLEELLQQAIEQNFLDREQKATIFDWQKSPATWSAS